MSKTDIQSAFRIMPIHPNDNHLLGFSWEGEFSYDIVILLVLVVVAAYSKPQARHRSGSLLPNLVALQWYISWMISYLLIQRSKVAHDLNAFLTLCRDIDIPIAVDKTVSACITITCMGICLTDFRLDCPMIRCKSVGNSCSCIQEDSCMLHELQSLLGLISAAQ